MAVGSEQLIVGSDFWVASVILPKISPLKRGETTANFLILFFVNLRGFLEAQAC